MQSKPRSARSAAADQTEDGERAAVLASLRAMRRTMARDFMASAVAALDDSDLTLVQMATLMLLEGCGEVTVRALGERFGRSTSAASRMLDQLVRRRLVSRVVDKTDRRVRRVALAARGRAVIEQMLSDRAEAQWQIMQRLSVRDRAQVTRAMRILQHAAERSSGDE